VDTVVPDGAGSVLDAVLAAAARYAAGATLAHGIVKDTFRDGLDVPLAVGLTLRAAGRVGGLRHRGRRWHPLVLRERGGGAVFPGR
jgi:hypothetical protein